MRCMSHFVQTLFYCHKFAWKPLNYNTIWRIKVGVHWLQFVWNQSKKKKTCSLNNTTSFQSRSNKSQRGGRSRYFIEHQIFISSILTVFHIPIWFLTAYCNFCIIYSACTELWNAENIVFKCHLYSATATSCSRVNITGSELDFTYCLLIYQPFLKFPVSSLIKCFCSVSQLTWQHILCC